ncbi:hypothetical protein COU54_02460 [Candidatus Pacearchaeota archaeon CG10_big_fil_rev_8_21_14_0_10_31_24]|nr:MAG: hypothetical protein COU54_02460 [Candidatus Pacearchaeota archaeon CG10_big_fil_rev_8_21_14_0_10_31_24]
MVSERVISLFVAMVLIVFISMSAVSALEFNGTVYNVDGNALNNSVVNVTIRNTNNWSVVGYNFTTTNSSGWFNITLNDTDTTLMFEPKITHRNATTNEIDGVGQSLPAFPASIFSELSGVRFYLRDAGIINLTAINGSGDRIAFEYQIKDTRMGYSIASDFTTKNTEVNIVVPIDRNYSIIIYPNQSLPVSFSWNNFSTGSSYNFNTSSSGILSSYNATTKILHKQFNTSLSFPRISGYFNSSSVAAVPGWDEFGVVAYILEPGNMIHSTFGNIPYNLSSFIGSTDVFNSTTGFYNMSVPASAEGASYILFGSGRNDTEYYGSVNNISLTYGDAETHMNLSAYGLLGIPANFSIDNANNWTSKKDIKTAKQYFQVVNSTNSSLSGVSVHVEITVNYSEYGSIEFTWMDDAGQATGGNFSVPLLNVTGIKEMNVYVSGGDYSPKRVKYTASRLISDNIANGNVSNLTITSFNPQAIDSVLAASSITMALYSSNSTCDVPGPPSGCNIASSSTMSDFNPMSAIMGGGKISFRMGTGNIQVHYVNVDMMASGPPDALFDNSNTDNGDSSSFDQAIRFGSAGPTIYDYVLVSIAYGESAGSGLDDSVAVNMSLPLLYDDDWSVIWNSTDNGTEMAGLAANYSHYAPRQEEWKYLLNQSTCTSNLTLFNISNPCFINTTSNVVWIRLPHFSGTGPSITGSVVAAASSSSSSSSSSGGGGGAVTSDKNTTSEVTWSKTYIGDNDRELSEKGVISRSLGAKERIRLLVGGAEHHVGVISVSGSDSVLVEVSSSPREAILKVGESEKFDVTDNNFYDLQVTLNDISDGKANVSIVSINEAVVESGSENVSGDTDNSGSADEEVSVDGKIGGAKSGKLKWTIYILVSAILIVIFLFYFLVLKNKRSKL